MLWLSPSRMQTRARNILRHPSDRMQNTISDKDDNLAVPVKPDSSAGHKAWPEAGGVRSLRERKACKWGRPGLWSIWAQVQQVPLLRVGPLWALEWARAGLSTRLRNRRDDKTRHNSLERYKHLEPQKNHSCPCRPHNMFRNDWPRQGRLPKLSKLVR